MTNSTASSENTEKIPGWYVEFLASLVRQAPRPGELSQKMAELWMNRQGMLKKALQLSLCHPEDSASKATAPALPPKVKLLLDPVGTVTIAATTTKFIARERFILDTGRKAKVKVRYLGDNFKSWFLSDDGKIEDSITEQTLRYGKLLKVSVMDGPIIAELGGADKSETTLSEMFFLMEKQGKGEDGVFLNNDYDANIFYVKDTAGVLRAVSVRWAGGGWGVYACSVESPDGWHGGCQVFSRNAQILGNFGSGFVA